MKEVKGRGNQDSQAHGLGLRSSGTRRAEGSPELGEGGCSCIRCINEAMANSFGHVRQEQRGEGLSGESTGHTVTADVFQMPQGSRG